MDKSELSFKFSIPITLDDVNGYKQAMSSYMSLLHTYEIAIKKRDSRAGQDQQDFNNSMSSTNNQLRASIEQNIFIRADSRAGQDQQDIAVQTEQEPIKAETVEKVEKVKKIRKPRIVKPVGNEIIL